MSERKWPNGLEIKLGNTTVLKDAVICHSHNGDFPTSGVLNLDCNTAGQHLYLIKKTEPKELRICEVEAYGMLFNDIHTLRKNVSIWNLKLGNKKV